MYANRAVALRAIPGEARGVDRLCSQSGRSGSQKIGFGYTLETQPDRRAEHVGQPLMALPLARGSKVLELPKKPMS